MARTTIGGESAEVDFVRCLSTEVFMWAVFVVPLDNCTYDYLNRMVARTADLDGAGMGDVPET